MTVGIVIAIIQLRNLNQTRQIQLYMQVLEHTRTREFMEALNDVLWLQVYDDHKEWEEKFTPQKNPSAYTSFSTVISVFQSIGFLVRRKILDPYFLYESFPYGILLAWRKAEPIIKFWRERENDPVMFDSFEYLANEMKKIMDQRIIYDSK